MVTVYKVVKPKWPTGVYVSAVVGTYIPSLEHTYVVGEATHARVGRLMAFDSQYNAERFAGDIYGSVVFEAEADSAHPITTRIPCVTSTVCERIAKWWAGVWNGDLSTSNAPTGTVACGWIKLLEKQD
jgi:hypothetical protein